ncbi:SGNH/GDSL hydrolase family protein [Flavobacteriaceae bacterium]|jgi:lysophospholipase L1-like esterase|nr:SGNH/GDSL hydrolase family protein [Flavobacteriaceae bacterium]
MNLKYIILSVFLLQFITQDINAQNWSEFANTGYYAKANLELKLHSKTENRVVFMGNSITEGWVFMRPEFFENRDYINRGIGGQTTPQMLLRFRPDVVDLNPKVVLILAGTNDIAGNTGFTPLETIIGNIKSMAEIANANGIEVVISSILPAIKYLWKPGLNPAPKIISINKQLKAYAQQNNFIYLDYFTAMVDDNDGLKVPDYTAADDLVHPNVAGYLVMEKLAEKAIETALSR